MSKIGQLERELKRKLEWFIENFLWLIIGLGIFSFFGVAVTFNTAARDLIAALNLQLGVTCLICLFLLQLSNAAEREGKPSKTVLLAGGWASIALAIIALGVTGAVGRVLLGLGNTGGLFARLFDVLWGASQTSFVLSTGAIAGGAMMLLTAATLEEEAEENDPATFYGTARLAKAEEMAQLRLLGREDLTPGSVVIGPADQPQGGGLMVLPRMLSAQHGVIFGGTGTGKSRGYFLPNCAWAVDTSIVCTDPKSELWKYTSGFHHKALRYAPADPSASECFNWIPLCRDARMAELSARAIMESGSHGEVQFWIDTETAYLAAIFAHTATLAEPTPLTAYRLFTRQRPAQLLDQLLNSPSEVAREQAIIFAQTDTKIRGSIVPAVAAKLQFMRDANVARFTSARLEAPHFGELRRRATAVYWCLREQDISRLRPLTSLFFAVMLEQLAGEEIPEGETIVPVTMLLDEFANVGTIPEFATTISLARGRGVGIWLGVQSLSQLEARYGRPNAQTILTNCTTKIALHGLDVTTAKYVSEMLGETTVVVNRRSHTSGTSGRGGSSSVTRSRTEHRRPLMTSDEVMRLGENEALVRTGNRHPMRLAKMYYEGAPRTAQASALGQARALEIAPAKEQPAMEEPPKLPELTS